MLVTSFKSVLINGAEQSGERYDDLYVSGVDAYNEERWFECVTLMVQALDSYREYKRDLTRCRVTCKRRHAVQKLPSNSDHDNRDRYLDLIFYESVTRNADCLRRCKRQMFGEEAELVTTDPEITEAFNNLEPYNYIQLCFHKLGENRHAAAAAYTYFLGNPKHQTMIRNIHQYREMSDVSDSDFINMEAYKHQQLYSKGSRDYLEEKWLDVIDRMEGAIAGFMEQLESCEAMCEETINHRNRNTDFVVALADHYSDVIKCSSKCSNKLSTVHGKFVFDYIPDHYNYLQYAYYKLNDFRNAARCVQSYLLFKPTDENLLHNKKIYLSMPGVRETDFKPRPEAVRLHNRHADESALLKYLETLYTTSESRYYKPVNILKKPVDLDDPIKMYLSYLRTRYTQNDNNEEESLRKPNVPNVVFETKEEDNFLFKHQMKTFERRGIETVRRDAELGGDKRVVVNGLLSRYQCKQLIQIAQLGGVNSFGRTDIPTKVNDLLKLGVELIRDLKLDKATELANLGTLKWDATEAYMEMVELVRSYLQTYYNRTVLHFQDIQLVCRQVKTDVKVPELVKQKTCVPQEDGSCRKLDNSQSSPFRAVVFLNNDFEGDGKFYFDDSNRKASEQVSVAPSCGTMVAYRGTDQHRIGTISSNDRCVLSVGLTSDQNDRNTDFLTAKRHLAVARMNGYVFSEEKILGDKMAEFKREGVSISMDETELKGAERVAADGVITDEQCNSLVQLAKMGGLTNDGYDDKTSDKKHVLSPHSAYEHFIGVNIRRASQLASKGDVKPADVKLYLDASEKAKNVVETYFQLKRPLYFDFTHLVCRTALNETNKDRDDLSHPIHSDNCIIQEDFTCRKELPAYTQRDYSALLYLNEDFEGGEFIFAHRNLSTQVLVKPKCGRLVGFNAGVYHGVKAVLKGQRCAIAMWYTLDPYYKEQAHSTAREKLISIGKTSGTGDTGVNIIKDEL
ncbi:prolyl 3-hydroxylase 2-like isoform X2 [Tubulanus polymorphus]|uniref:prolyl 3-hydroxylase 2-like isoform X2 n=1 Tax=Tubulanus polymorphus TaxID=672921 RepID=UPI003DA2AF5B